MKRLFMTLWIMGLMALIGLTEQPNTTLDFDNEDDLPEYVTLDFDNEDDLPEYVTLDFDNEDDLPEYVTLDFDNEDDLPEYVTLGICRDQLQELLDEVVARQARSRHPRI